MARRDPRPRHRGLPRRPRHRDPRGGGRHRGGRRPVGHAGERQGDHGRALAGGGHGDRAVGRRRRPRLRGHADHHRRPRPRRIRAAAAAGSPSTPRPRATARRRTARATHDRATAASNGAVTPYTGTKGDVHAEVLVLGAGPGGYTAAFRAADLGKSVVLVDSRGPLGGVCLNIGCIPSKALLHAAKVIAETKEMSAHGLSFAAPTIDLDALRAGRTASSAGSPADWPAWPSSARSPPSSGTGTFTGPNTLAVTGTGRVTSTVSFDAAIIAAGSEPVQLPFVPHDDPRVIDSTGALELERHPRAAARARRRDHRAGDGHRLRRARVAISVVELMDQLIPGCGQGHRQPAREAHRQAVRGDLARHQGHRRERGPGRAHRVLRRVGQQGPRKAPETAMFDAVLVAVGRRPNGTVIGARRGGRVRRRARLRPGRQAAAHQRRAHLRDRRRRRAADARAQGRARGQGRRREHRREDELLRRHASSRRWPTPTPRWRGSASPRTRPRPPGVKYGKGTFPWAASGRSLSLGRDEGLTKVLFDEARPTASSAPGSSAPTRATSSPRPPSPSRLGADAADIGLTIHPHPTLSETVGHGRRGVRGHPHRPLPAQEEVGRRRHAPRRRTSPISAAGAAPWCCARRGGQRRRKSRNAALTSSGWVHPMLCGPSGTLTTVRSAMSRSSRSRAAVASNGRMRSAPHRTANG